MFLCFDGTRCIFSWKYKDAIFYIDNAKANIQDKEGIIFDGKQSEDGIKGWLKAKHEIDYEFTNFSFV